MEKYKTLKIVGKGSFGKAILVQLYDDPNQHYVMKIIDASKLDKRQKEEALNEIHVLKAMRHPYVITYRESFIEKRHLCIVMDYANGGDLSTRINQQRQKNQYFSEDQILDWFVQIALAIKHIHDRKILHRDLKTQNIFLTAQGEIKLGDFGIAQVLESPDDHAKTAIGTPYYLSPEICQEKPYNQKSDIWSLGCILYEMVMLSHAFKGDSIRSLVKNILYGAYTPIPESFSSNIRELISEMLTKDPLQRPSIKEILQKDFLAERINKLLRNTLLIHSKNMNEINYSSFLTKSPLISPEESKSRINIKPLCIPQGVNISQKFRSSSSQKQRNIILEEKSTNSHRALQYPVQERKRIIFDNSNRTSQDISTLKHKKPPLSERNNRQEDKRSNYQIKPPFKQDQNLQINIDYIIQQNLNLINEIGLVKDFPPANSKEKVNGSSPMIKSHYQIIYNNIKSTKVHNKIWNDHFEKTSEMGLITKDDTRPETQLSTEKFQNSFVKNCSKIALEDTRIAENEKIKPNSKNVSKVDIIRSSLEKFLGIGKLQKTNYCHQMKEIKK